MIRFFLTCAAVFQVIVGEGVGESCRLFYADEFGFLVFRWLVVKKQAKNDVFELFFNDFDLKKLRFLEHAPSLKKFKGAVKQNRCRENGTKRGTVWENLATEIERGGGGLLMSLRYSGLFPRSFALQYTEAEQP